MVADLLNYSIIIIGLAVFGFILKDTYYMYRRYCAPYEFKNSTDSYFSHISLAIAIISICWIIIILPLTLTSDAELAIKAILENFAKLAEFGVLTEEEVINYFREAAFGIYVFTWFAYAYVVIYFITLILGVLAIYFDPKTVVITYQNQKQQEYKRIILESGDFVYFEKDSNFRDWEGVPKGSIVKIESKASKSKFDRFLARRLSTVIENHKILGNPRKRAIALVFCLGLLIALVVSSNLTEHFVVKVLLIAISVPIVILVLIENALR